MTNSIDSLEWIIRRENDITHVEHRQLAVLLTKSYPLYSETYTGLQSWNSARPELRVIGKLNGEPIAHLGLLRRFISISERDSDQLVGDVGLVCIDPQERKRGIGKLLLGHSARLMSELNLPYGFLTCDPKRTSFYEASGWQKLERQAVRMIDEDQTPQITHSVAMVLPVSEDLSNWSKGHLIDRNGWEV
jgi:nodulation protein A